MADIASNSTDTSISTGFNSTDTSISTGSRSSDSSVQNVNLVINVDVDSSKSVKCIMLNTENSSDSSKESHPRYKKLANFLSCIDSNKSYAKYIAESRRNKMIAYNTRREKELERIFSHPLIISSKADIEKWYDLFQSYAIMGYINIHQYWTCMKKLDYPFAKFSTRIHNVFFKVLSTSVATKMDVIEFIVSIIIFLDQAPNLLSKIQIFNDIYKGITPDMIYDFPTDELYEIHILDKSYTITRDILCKILEKSKHNEDMRILFYTLFDWIPINYQ